MQLPVMSVLRHQCYAMFGTFMKHSNHDARIGLYLGFADGRVSFTVELTVLMKM
jgi:hypothetical protein